MCVELAEALCSDCDGNGRIDECEVADGTAEDCNENGLIDKCEIADGTVEDCNGNWVPDQCDLVDDDTEDCNGNGLPDRGEGPTFCPDSSRVPVDLIVIADPSGSDGGKLEGLCQDVFDVAVAGLADEFDLRAVWTSVQVQSPTQSTCHDWTMPTGTQVPTCGGGEDRTIDDPDGDGEEWGDASAVMTTPYEPHLLGQLEGWDERDAVLILIPISDEGPQDGDDDGDCDCADEASVSNLIRQAWLENVQIVPMPTPDTQACVFDPDDSSSLMRLTADETGGSVVDARAWPSGTSSNELAQNLEAAIRAAVAVSPRVACPECPADLNGDGCVDGGDLGLFLTYWGSSDEFSPGNLDGQAPVNGADLGVLLTAWGVCPGVERCGE